MITCSYRKKILFEESEKKNIAMTIGPVRMSFTINYMKVRADHSLCFVYCSSHITEDQQSFNSRPMELPNSAEGLTRLLRGRDTTPEQIYGIVSKFDTLGFYFPSKEIFIMELIVDRWNDTKKIDFREDGKTWAIFNKMWAEIHDDIILKNLFKRLRFVPLLDAVLTSVDLNVDTVLPHILETCKLVNSTTTMEVSFEHGCKILSNSLEMVSRTDETSVTDAHATSFIREIIRLIGFENIGELNYKMSVSFCNDLLLSCARYVSGGKKNEARRGNHEVVEILSSYFGKFVFGKEINSLLLLDKFFKKNKENIDTAIAITLFEESNKFLIKSDFQKLETIFEYIVAIQPEVTAVLLAELASSKKTLSHDFLKKLFEQTTQSAEEKDLYDNEFWQLIGNMLDLDLEIGIENHKILMTLLENQRHIQPTSAIIFDVWKKFLKCYLNAREFEKFLDSLNEYCLKNLGFIESTVFLNDKEFADEISKNIVTLSTSQLVSIFSKITDRLLSKDSDAATFRIAKVYMSSLQYISYTILPELKKTFTKLFDSSCSNDEKLWEIKYMAMQTYDDIINENQTDGSSKSQIEELLSQSNTVSRELLLYILKLREYEDFDVSLVETKILDFLKTSKDEDKENILIDIFTNWPSIVNALFSRDSINELTKIIISDFIQILDILFVNDEFFEENNVMFQLISNLASNLSSVASVTYLCMIPIECFNKKTRIAIIDEVTGKTSLTDDDTSLLEHLLSTPTFRSKTESDFDCLLSVVNKSLMESNCHILTNNIFDKILKNHLSQIKETVSENFLDLLNKKITEGIKNDEFNRAIFSMAISFSRQIQGTTIQFDSLFLVTKLIQWTRMFIKDVNNENIVWVVLALHAVFNNSTIDTETRIELKQLVNEGTKQNVFQPTEVTSLTVPMFLLYSLTFDGPLEIIFSQYIVMRDCGIAKEDIISAIDGVVTRRITSNELEVRNAVLHTILSLRDKAPVVVYSSILELLQILFSKLSNEEDNTTELFGQFLSELLTNISNLSDNQSDILAICTMIQNVQITKPRLFTQYGTELLFPLCYKINSMAINDTSLNDQLFIASSKIISNILNFHRTKLSNRYHLINTFLCECLSLFSNQNTNKFSSSSAMALGRLIVNFCEPTISSTSSSKNEKQLSSNTGIIKKNVRRYAPALLIKYVHICITSNIGDDVRKELTPAMYAILDLVSQNELNQVGKILDNSGRQYFKVLYAEYKRLGKWHER